MGVAEVIAIIGMVVALLLLLLMILLYQDARAERGRREELLAKAELCRQGLRELQELLAELDALRQQPNHDRCVALNARIRSWNDRYVPGCATSRVPEIDCGG